MNQRIPTNIITGFLGVGKTTAILDLLANKPNDERWAVLVNEYGEVSIDAAILEGGAASNGITIREVAGGCVCCATAPYLQVALHLLLTEAKPHRLIVETTGLGHPGQLLEKLRGPAYADRLDVRATLAIVSPDDFTTPEMLQNPVFREQVDMADVLVLNKLDRADSTLIENFRQWAEQLYPRKEWIAATQSGRLEAEWLDFAIVPHAVDPFAMAAAPESAAIVESTDFLAKPGQPTRHVSPGSTSAAGWIFHPADTFDEMRLLRCLSSWPQITRLKGIFHTPDDWFVVQRVSGSTTIEPTTYRRDSRIELFGNVPDIDWNAVEADLIGCLEGTRCDV